MSFVSRIVSLVAISVLSTVLPPTSALAVQEPANASVSSANISSSAPPTSGVPSQAAWHKAVGIVKRSPRFAKTEAELKSFKLVPQVALSKFGEKKAWVGFTGNNGNQSVLVRAAIDLPSKSVVLVQRVRSLAEPGTGATHVTIDFDDQTTAWSGNITAEGKLIPATGFQTQQEIQQEQRKVRVQGGCRDTIGDICSVFLGGDTGLACLLLAGSGWGAVGCLAASIAVTYFGCKKLQSMICD